MRTSNKILLGGFLLAIMIVIGIHMTIYAKIKNGDTEVVKQNAKKNTESFALPNINNVVIKSMEECRIWPHDSASIEVPKNWQKHFRYRIVGDTLFVEGGKPGEYDRGGRSYMPVDLYLPPVQDIVGMGSNLYVSGANDTITAKSRTFKLFSSHLWLTGNQLNTTPAYWDSVYVLNSVQSTVNINEGGVVKDMSVLLSASSTLNDSGGKFGSITLKVDSSSSANLRTGSLSTLKFIKL
jgi:hypothetical protein